MVVNDLIVRAFKFVHILGAGETLSGEEANDAFDDLNDIIELTIADKTLSIYKTFLQFTLTPNKFTYTVGPAGSTPTPDVIAPRPVEILSGFTRRSNIDLPLFVGQRQDYERVQLKNLVVAGWTQMIYYDGAYPVGTIYFYLVPGDSYTTAFLTVNAQLSPFVTLNDTIAFPPVYQAWLRFKLAERAAPAYGMPFTAKMQDVLNATEATLKANNLRPFPVAVSGLGTLGGRRGGQYNVYSDNTR